MLENYIIDIINAQSEFKLKIEDVKKKLNITSFIEYLYNSLNIPIDKNKYIDTHKLDYIYLESERIQNKNDLKVFCCLYYYKDTPRKLEYIDCFLSMLSVFQSETYNLNDYYIYLYIDFTIFLNFNNDILLQKFIKTALTNNKVLIQFYYGQYNLCIKENQIYHNNSYGTLIRFLPFIFHENISECHIRDIDLGFINYSSYLVAEDIKNSNKNIYLTASVGDSVYTVNHIREYKQYNNINNYHFAAGCLGFIKNNKFIMNEDIKLFQTLLINFITNKNKDIVTKNNYNYEYGIDEVFLFYYYYKCSKNIHILNGNELLNYIIFVGKNISCIFNNNIDNIDLIYLRDHLTLLVLFMYNIDYIEDNKLLETFKYIFKHLYNIDINNMIQFINIIKYNNLYKQYYAYLHFKTKEHFLKFITIFTIYIGNFYNEIALNKKIHLIHQYKINSYITL